MKKSFIQAISGHLQEGGLNQVTAEYALHPKHIGTPLFEAPLFAFGDAGDPLFEGLRQKEAIGNHVRMPQQWVPSAKTVISIYLPFTREIVASNVENYQFPSDLWLHGRIEGQRCINDLAQFGVTFLESQGYATVAPSIHPDFFSAKAGAEFNFTSNWSERHCAFICGLGTFGLTRGIITEKGAAGRLLSFITTADFPKTTRKYEDLYEYCIMCGLCAKRCPAQAITVAGGKDHVKCSNFIDQIEAIATPWYGCGKCQVNLPCTFQNPRHKG